MPGIARKDWPSHPNYPANLLLLGSHANFRYLSEHVIGRAKRSSPDRYDLDAAYIEGLYLRWIAAMRSHEAYEERKLYPYLARRWGASFTTAKEGHLALHAADARVRAALRARKDKALAERGLSEVESALEAHHRVLDAHLLHEEDLVIPLLLSLSREEFENYCERPVEELLRELSEGEVSV